MNDADATSGDSHPLIIVVLAVGGVALLTEMAIHAPAPARKLVLFSVVYGIGIGAITAIATQRLRFPKFLMLLLAVVTTIAGLVGVAMDSHRRLIAEQRAADAEQKSTPFDPAMLEQLAENDPQLKASLEKQRRSRESRFVDYLALRVRSLGDWTAPWPLVLWIAEIVLAVTACVGIIIRWTRPTPQELDTSE